MQDEWGPVISLLRELTTETQRSRRKSFRCGPLRVCGESGSQSCSPKAIGAKAGEILRLRGRRPKTDEKKNPAAPLRMTGTVVWHEKSYSGAGIVKGGVSALAQAKMPVPGF